MVNILCIIHVTVRRLLHFNISAVGHFAFFLGEGFHNLHRDVVRERIEQDPQEQDDQQKDNR